MVVIALATITPARAQRGATIDSAFILMIECNPAAGLDPTCFHYLLGMVDGANKTRSAFCIPNSVTSPQLPVIYFEYAQKHRELWGSHRGDVAYKAFQAAFPCR